MDHFPWGDVVQTLGTLGLGGLALAWMARWLIPQLHKQLKDESDAFREQIRLQSGIHAKTIDELTARFLDHLFEQRKAFREELRAQRQAAKAEAADQRAAFAKELQDQRDVLLSK